MATLGQLSGATRLFPIIGDPIKYVESPMRLTRTFEERGYNGICVPMQVADDDLDAAMARAHGLAERRRDPRHHAAQVHRLYPLRHQFWTRQDARGRERDPRNPDRTWHGDMLDGLAFVKAQQDHGAEPEGARVLLVGAGGAGSAIAQDVMADFMLRHTDSPTGWRQYSSKVIGLARTIEKTRARFGQPS
jgi:shikimate dehydrogenase